MTSDDNTTHKSVNLPGKGPELDRLIGEKLFGYEVVEFDEDLATHYFLLVDRAGEPVNQGFRARRGSDTAQGAWADMPAVSNDCYQCGDVELEIYERDLEKEYALTLLTEVGANPTQFEAKAQTTQDQPPGPGQF